MLTEGTAGWRGGTGRLFGVSAGRSLHELAGVATRNLPGCAAAAVVVWEASAPREVAASHPELGRLLELEWHLGRGPTSAARDTGQPVALSDTLRDERRPRYAAAAVRYGVRSLLVVPLEIEGYTVTFALHATRPCTWNERDARTLVPLLAAQIAVILRAIDGYGNPSPRAAGHTAPRRRRRTRDAFWGDADPAVRGRIAADPT